MKISNISSAVFIFLAIFMIFLPTVMFARHVGLSPQTYHDDDIDGDRGEDAAWHGITTKNVVAAQENNSGSSRENMSRYNIDGGDKQMGHMKRARPLQVAAGSRLPDCSHACGSCTPCRLVMVSFACAALAEAETCPISYRCICNSKSYPVP
ncbi:uncharacterized protein LOC21408360 [Morus notabilis]|nr:uncharacterized protein LOC21408360 [Morus notabilis]